MSVDLNSREYKIRAWAGSLIFLIGIALAIGGMLFFQTERLTPVFIVNVSMDICAMFLGYILYICAVIDKQWDGDNLDIFLLMIVTVFVGLYADMLCWLTDGKAEYRGLCIAANTVYFCISPILAYLFWRYVLTFLNVEKERSHKYDVLFRIGLIVDVLIRILNLFLGFIFTVDASGIQRIFLYCCLYIFFHSPVIDFAACSYCTQEIQEIPDNRSVRLFFSTDNSGYYFNIHIRTVTSLPCVYGNAPSYLLHT